MKTVLVLYVMAFVFVSPHALAQKPKAAAPDLMSIVELGEGTYLDKCRERMAYLPSISICRAGNGWYNETIITDFFAKRDWFERDRASAGKLKQVRFVCRDLAGQKPEVARLVIPLQQEYRLGNGARIEIPCNATRDQIAQQMKSIAEVLPGLESNGLSAVVEKIDQVRAVCESKSESANRESCEKTRKLVAKVLTSQITTEAVPVFTIGAIQLVAGLEQAPLTVKARDLILPVEAVSQDPQAVYLEEQLKIEQELTAQLPSCGISLAERAKKRPDGLVTFKDPMGEMKPSDTSKIRWRPCLDEIERQKKDLERLGIDLKEPGLVKVDGKEISTFEALGSQDIRVRKAMLLNMRAGITQLDLALERAEKKNVPGNKTNWEDAVRNSRLKDAEICLKRPDEGIAASYSGHSSSEEQIIELAREISVRIQAFDMAKKQGFQDCVVIQKVRVTSPGKLEFTFAPEKVSGESDSSNAAKAGNPVLGVPSEGTQ